VGGTDVDQPRNVIESRITDLWTWPDVHASASRNVLLGVSVIAPLVLRPSNHCSIPPSSSSIPIFFQKATKHRAQIGLPKGISSSSSRLLLRSCDGHFEQTGHSASKTNSVAIGFPSLKVEGQKDGTTFAPPLRLPLEESSRLLSRWRRRWRISIANRLSGSHCSPWPRRLLHFTISHNKATVTNGSKTYGI
jgi:hypothetical protein